MTARSFIVRVFVVQWYHGASALVKSLSAHAKYGTSERQHQYDGATRRRVAPLATTGLPLPMLTDARHTAAPPTQQPRPFRHAHSKHVTYAITATTQEAPKPLLSTIQRCCHVPSCGTFYACRVAFHVHSHVTSVFHYLPFRYER